MTNNKNKNVGASSPQTQTGGKMDGGMNKKDWKTPIIQWCKKRRIKHTVYNDPYRDYIYIHDFIDIQDAKFFQQGRRLHMLDCVTDTPDTLAEALVKYDINRFAIFQSEICVYGFVNEWSIHEVREIQAGNLPPRKFRKWCDEHGYMLWVEDHDIWSVAPIPDKKTIAKWKRMGVECEIIDECNMVGLEFECQERVYDD